MEVQTTKTLCENCIFATYNDDNTQQTGCELGRIEKYQALGCVVSAKNEETGRQSYVIDNRVCMACRNSEWVEIQKEDTKKTEWETLVKKEMTIQYQAMVFHDSTEEDLKKTVFSLAGQSIKPKKIIIISRKGITETARFVEWLDSLVDIKWKVQNILNPVFTDEECISLVQQVGGNQYYSVFHSGFEVPSDTFQQINELITEQMFQFAMISPNSSGNGTIVSNNVHKYYKTNTKKSLKTLIEEDGCQENIVPITTIMPNFPQ